MGDADGEAAPLAATIIGAGVAGAGLLKSLLERGIMVVLAPFMGVP